MEHGGGCRDDGLVSADEGRRPGGGFKGKAACFDAASGAVVWEFSTGGASATTCGVDRDGTVYVSAGSKVYALSPEGEQRWSYDLGTTADMPCVGADAVYVGSAGGKLVALDKQGGLKWETTVPGYIRSPSLDREGNLYCVASPFTLYAFDSSGEKLWEAKPEGDLPPGEALYEWANTLDIPSIGADGTIYAGSMPGPLKGEGGIPVSPGAAARGKLYAFSPDGRIKWSYSYEGSIPSEYLLIHSPSIAKDGTLYCGTSIWRVLAISPAGKLVWECNTGEGSDVCPSVYSPSIDSAGMLYAATTSGKMICINAQGQEQWRYDSGMPWLPSHVSNNMTPPPIGADGTLFSVMASGKLLAW
ncbi:MAG: PQQ-binding-like beta-propeller repeat protein [Actinobacteria bacterium]|nr:PQQ-binding-like beta-propeller repeat protein [Actinomycetota bacterium]